MEQKIKLVADVTIIANDKTVLLNIKTPITITDSRAGLYRMI
jgi:hypothetical protein